MSERNRGNEWDAGDGKHEKGPTGGARRMIRTTYDQTGSVPQTATGGGRRKRAT